MIGARANEAPGVCAQRSEHIAGVAERIAPAGGNSVARARMEPIRAT